MRALRAILCLFCCSMAAVSLSVAGAQAVPETGHRTTLSLNGQWDVAESIGANEILKIYTHKAPVPGLTHAAVPAFPDVDQYQNRELLSNLVRQGRFSQADYDKLGDARGISH